MCFSATASFTAAAFLLGFGTMTVSSAHHRRERPYASIPLLFAVQQFTEGVVWLSFDLDAPWLNVAMTQLYSLFSHVLWPIYIPLAILLIEPLAARRRMLLAVVLAGSSVGLYLLYSMFQFPIVSRPSGQHIEYVSPHFFIAATITFYLLSTTFSLILSTHRSVQIFGALVLLSFGLAYWFYARWFISVWCFFAAVLSFVVYLYFVPSRFPSNRSRHSG